MEGLGFSRFWSGKFELNSSHSKSDKKKYYTQVPIYYSSACLCLHIYIYIISDFCCKLYCCVIIVVVNFV